MTPEWQGFIAGFSLSTAGAVIAIVRLALLHNEDTRQLHARNLSLRLDLDLREAQLEIVDRENRRRLGFESRVH